MAQFFFKKIDTRSLKDHALRMRIHAIRTLEESMIRMRRT
jgi:hypothetical protein